MRSPDRTHGYRGLSLLVVLLLAAGCATAGAGGSAVAEAAPAAPAPAAPEAVSAPTAAEPSGPAMAARPGAPGCANTVTADVVALDQAFFLNRLGANQPTGMIFALRRDVVATDGSGTLQPGKVAMRPDRRPRPLALRVNQGDCLRIDFENLLASDPVTGVTSTIKNPFPVATQPATRKAGAHAMGMSLVAAYDAAGNPIETAISADASFIGVNPSSLVGPGGKIAYVYQAEQEGTYLLYSSANTYGDSFFAGQLTAGLFGAVHVEPPGAVWLRSQVSQADLAAATTGRTEHGQPIIDYDATRADGTPILRMLDARNRLVYGDLTAVIAYQDPRTGQLGSFPDDPGNPLYFEVPASPDRTQPFREITVIYHRATAGSKAQAFACAYNGPGPDGKSTCPPGYGEMDPYLSQPLSAAVDQFLINYGSGGIGSEILANRLGFGPEGDCLACKYEEFFLSSWPLGDPAQVVTYPADPDISRVHLLGENLGDNRVWYPDDPSNVYHSYLRDHTKFRVLHGGAQLHHIHHQHAHQWLHSPNNDRGHYLDSQAVGPGSGYTLEMVYGGSGNRNETVGDSIFHCHFYPHFAQGMWGLWRVHDVFEAGTELEANGLPKAPVYESGRLVEPGARALPDGEIRAGTPTPAVVPMPSLAMPPVPGRISLSEDGRRALPVAQGPGGEWKVLTTLAEMQEHDYQNPGYPFFIPGHSGQRAPRPPLDVPLVKQVDVGGKTQIVKAQPGDPGAYYFDGGLPRQLLFPPPGKKAQEASSEFHNRWSFEKKLHEANGVELAEDGEPVEKVAMAFHAQPVVPSCTPDGVCGKGFALNGLPAVAGAPFADPCGEESDGWNGVTRHYRGANIQTDVVFNKEGWHYPQQRIITLWDDVGPTLDKSRPPEPFFFRANSRDCVEYWQTNLVPLNFALDDWQVRTPTDILGQHIHLVKFDVTASDGAANGFNYEDGTLSPGEITERIEAINESGGLLMTPESRTCPDGSPIPGDRRCRLEPRLLPNVFNIDPESWPTLRKEWSGAMASVQRWMADPLENNAGQDRTVRTVFTHDHFGPSTHQQGGLYAGLLVEPESSLWLDMSTGAPLGGRNDGGPTSWRANIVTEDRAESYREFALEFQDMLLVYPPGTPNELEPYPAQLACSAGKSGTVFDARPGVNCAPGEDPAAHGCNSYANPDAFFNYGVPGAGTGSAACGWNSQAANCQSFQQFSKVPTSSTPCLGPWPQAISFNGGLNSLNYRMEPPDPRLANADGSPPAPGAHHPRQSAAHVFRSIERDYPPVNRPGPIQYTWDGSKAVPVTGGTAPGYAPFKPVYERTLTPLVSPHDPFTPILQGFEGDRVQIRTLVGAHIFNHQFVTRGPAFFFEPSAPNSGYRAAQAMGISEHFELNFVLPPNPFQERDAQRYPHADYLYQSDASLIGIESGTWGILRSYGLEDAAELAGREQLQPLPSNPPRELARLRGPEYCSPESRRDPVRYEVYALSTRSFVPEQAALIYGYQNNENVTVQLKDGSTQPTAAVNVQGQVYVLAEDVERTAEGLWRLVPGRVFEPLVLRAPAGACIEVTFTNFFSAPSPVQRSARIDPAEAEAKERQIEQVEQILADNPISPIHVQKLRTLQRGPDPVSIWAGLYPQGVAFDPLTGSGYNVGDNPVATPGAGESRTYYWYAGRVEPDAGGGPVWTPVEFGAANLLPADPVTQPYQGLYGALIIEPAGSEWREDPYTRLSATVTRDGRPLFREFVMASEDGVALNPSASTPYGAFSSVNYGSSPRPLTDTQDLSGNLSDRESGLADFSQVYDQGNAAYNGEPPTTLFAAHAGTPVRLRMVYPAGAQNSEVFTLHGHGWQEEPYQVAGDDGCGATGCFAAKRQVIAANQQSQWMGSMMGYGAGEHFDFVLEPVPLVTGEESYVIHNGAGGTHKVPGDYLYRTFTTDINGGMWGLFRVGPETEAADIVAITHASWERRRDGGCELKIMGRNTPVLEPMGAPGFVDPKDMRIFGSSSHSQGSCSGTPLNDDPSYPVRWIRTSTAEVYENGQTSTAPSRTFEVQDGRTRTWAWQGARVVTPPAYVCAQSPAGGYMSVKVDAPSQGCGW